MDRLGRFIEERASALEREDTLPQAHWERPVNSLHQPDLPIEPPPARTEKPGGSKLRQVFAGLFGRKAK